MLFSCLACFSTSPLAGVLWQRVSAPINVRTEFSIPNPMALSLNLAESAVGLSFCSKMISLPSPSKHGALGTSVEFIQKSSTGRVSRSRRRCSHLYFIDSGSYLVEPCCLQSCSALLAGRPGPAPFKFTCFFSRPISAIFLLTSFGVLTAVFCT